MDELELDQLEIESPEGSRGFDAVLFFLLIASVVVVVLAIVGFAHLVGWAIGFLMKH